jgi:hypothetical protein
MIAVPCKGTVGIFLIDISRGFYIEQIVLLGDQGKWET